jgi:hypothetical protein
MLAACKQTENITDVEANSNKPSVFAAYAVPGSLSSLFFPYIYHKNTSEPETTF